MRSGMPGSHGNGPRRRRGQLPGYPPVDDSGPIMGARQVPGCGGGEQVGDRVGAGCGQQQQGAAQGRPRRLLGEPVEQPGGVLVQAVSQLGPRRGVRQEVEGVEIAGGCGAEQANRILLLTMDLYSHVMPSALRDAADAMDRALSGGR
jgi:hypothetical protein